MKGTARKRGTGRWQIQVYAGADPQTGKDVRVTQTVVAPHTRAGRKIVDQAIAKLIVDVEMAGRSPSPAPSCTAGTASDSSSEARGPD